MVVAVPTRRFATCLAACFVACLATLAMPADAQVTTVELPAPTTETNLAAVASIQQVPVARGSALPDELWNDALTAPAADLERVRVTGDQLTVARVRLRLHSGVEPYVIHVPSSRIDDVTVYTRTPGAGWAHFHAGDLVALAEWPFFGQFPAFPVLVSPEGMDIVIVLRNQGPIAVPLLLNTEKVFLEGRARQSNLSGIVIGMGLMVAVVCLLSAVTQRTRASWVIFGFAVTAMLTALSINGYAAIWFLPDWPWLNDGLKLVTSCLLAAVFLWACASTLDYLDATRWLRRVAWLGPLAVMISFVLDYLLLGPFQNGPRLIVAAGFNAICMAGALLLCRASQVKGGRYIRFVAAAAACLGGALVFATSGEALYHGLDLRSAASATMLFSAGLFLRHAEFSRLRYGADVLGRAALSARRDPLTALLSYEGFAQHHAEVALREAAGIDQAAMMMLLLPGLERSGSDHGFELTERTLVRFAAGLQGLLGRRWVVGRLSKTRFAAISTYPMEAADLMNTATKVLALAGRIEQAPNPLKDFNLSIACQHREIGRDSFVETLRKLDAAAHSLIDGKRIAFTRVSPQPANALDSPT